MDFAEQGAGLPIFILSQFLIHSALDGGLSSIMIPTPGVSHSTEGGDGDESAVSLISDDEEWKEDERGAKTMLSV